MAFSLPTSMRTIEVRAPGGPEVLQVTTRSVPAFKADELLIQVMAVGINRADLMQRQGRYPPPSGASDVLGLEVAGLVVGVGASAKGYQVGERVCALLTGGGYAEFCVAPAAQCLPLPLGIDFIQGAALPEALFTVWTNVFDRGRLASAETLLVHGGASGIGTTAIQLAQARGARVFATVGSDEKAQKVESLGAERAINYHTEDFVAVVRGLTGERGADVILDIVGGDYLHRNVAALALEGRLVTVSVQSGSKGEIDLLQIMQRRLTLTGSTLRSRTVAEKAAIANALQREVWPVLAAGKIKPVIHAVFPLHQAAAAHKLMESGTHIGKIVLSINHTQPPT